MTGCMRPGVTTWLVGEVILYEILGADAVRVKDEIQVHFEIVGPITGVETVAVGRAIRELARLRRRYGSGRWRKLKGIATVRVGGGDRRRAEVH